MIFRRIIIAIKKVNTDNQPVKILSNFLGFGLIGFSIYILISLISYNAADSAYFYQTNDPNVMNLGGPLGAVVSDILLSTGISPKNSIECFFAIFFPPPSPNK